MTGESKELEKKAEIERRMDQVAYGEIKITKHKGQIVGLDVTDHTLFPIESLTPNTVIGIVKVIE